MPEKNLVLQLWPKMLSANLIAVFFIINISGRNQSISYIFCMEMIIKGGQDVRLPVLVGGGQMCLSYNQIAGFFDEHEYLWKESSDLCFFV